MDQEMSFKHKNYAQPTDAWLRLITIGPLSHLSPHFFQISYMDYFLQTLTQIIFLINHNQDSCQHGCCLSVCTCEHSNLVIYHQISSKFHISDTFFNLSPMFKYRFCAMNDYQDHQNGYHLFTAGIMRGSLTVIVYSIGLCNFFHAG